MPDGEPLPHAADMTSRPIKTAASGAHIEWAVGRPRPFRHPHYQIWRRWLEPPVIDNTAGKWRVLPVDIESIAQTQCSFVNSVSGDEDDVRDTPRDRKEMPVPGQQHTILFSAACGEQAVGDAALGNDRVVAGGAQPSPEPREHLVA